MSKRNSQFRVFFGHGSIGEHEAPMGTEKSAVSYRGHRAASCWPPAQAKKRNSKWFVSVVRLFHVEEKKSQVCRQLRRGNHR